MKKKLITIFLCLVMLVSLFPKIVVSAEETEENPQQFDVSRSKTATELDSEYQSTVTLSLPSAEENLASDIVFVLDKSSCKEETAASAKELFTALKNQVLNNGSKIQVSVVVFGGDAKVSYSLQQFPTTDEGLEQLHKALTTKPDGLMGGSNMHSGLLAAQEILSSSTTDNNRKYVILVSDGLTRLFTGTDGKTKDIYYQYTYLDKIGQKQVGTEDGQIHPKDCVYFGMIGEWVNVRTQSTSDSNYVVPYGSWNTYFNKVCTWVEADGDSYALDYETYGNDPTAKVKDSAGNIIDDNFIYIGHTDYENHAMSVDRAVYEAYYAFTDMVDEGYNCYALIPGTGTEFGNAFMGAMNEYANNTTVDFTRIGIEILYAVGYGSIVKDKIGAAFNLDENSFKLTVGGQELEKFQLFDELDNVWLFGDDEFPQFVVSYDPETKIITWYIYEYVSNFAPVQLSYTVKLENPKTEPGTYTEETNEYAVLLPVDSLGREAGELLFEVPTVTYKVNGQPATGDSSNITLWASLTLVSVSSAVITFRKKKKSLQ